MSPFTPTYLEHQRRRWTRCNAHLWQKSSTRSSEWLPSPRSLRRRQSSTDHRGILLEGLVELRQLVTGIKSDFATLANLRRVQLALKYGFNPGQPRIPAGNSNGGRWALSGPNYSQNDVGIQIDPSASTGILQIDQTTHQLATILKGVIDKIGVIPGLSPQGYGTLVHVGFAGAVRLAGIPGIGFNDVETTLRIGVSDPPYGLAGSVRTDVLLRNEVGDVVAIYDVKTGNNGLNASRVRTLRTYASVDFSIPVIELNVLRGPTLKSRAMLIVRG